MRRPVKRICVFALALAIILQALPVTFAAPDVPNDPGSAGYGHGAYVSTVPTPQDSDLINPDYDRSYDDYVIEENGFVHPGYILTREDLNVMRDMVWLGKSPWKESFELLMTSPYASVNYRTLGASEDLVGESQLYTMFQDMAAAFNLSVMWYITGDQAYADRAIQILMNWSETCVRDSRSDLIRNGHGMQKASMAAEILRYTPSSGWTEENTTKLTTFMKLLQTGVDRPDGYHNQGLFALTGWLGIAIFTNDKDMYETGVERAVYNVNHGRSQDDCNFSFSSEILDSGQLVELGRDVVHSVDDIWLLPLVAQALYAQGTKVTLEGSTVTITPDGEDLYEFQNQKLLKAMAYISKHGLGQEVSWYRENGWGITDRIEFSSITTGREPFTGMMAAYNHYRYVKGYEPDDQRTDPYMQNADGRYQALYGGDTTYGALYQPIETMSDIGGMEGMELGTLGCGDLFFTPWYAADPDDPGAGAPNRLPVVEDLYDVYIRQEGGHFDAADCESTPGNPPSFESFTDEDGVARNNLANTHLYSWVAYEVDFTDRYGSTADKLVDTFTMAHSHSGPVNTLTHNMIMYVGPYEENPTAATFAAAKANEVGRFVYANVGGFWNDYYVDSFKLHDNVNAELLTGKKTVYMYFTTSTSNYNYHTNVLWFKFSGGSAKNVDGNNPADADVLSASGAVKDAGSVTLTDGGHFGFYNFDFDKGFDAWSFTYQATGGGTLKLMTGDPDGGAPVKSMKVETTEGAVTADFDHTGQSAPRGLQDAYIVYEGEGSVTVTSFRSLDGKVFLPHDGDSYRNVAYGQAGKAGDGVAELAVIPGGRTRVGYYYIPFLEGPKTLNVRVRSDVAATLNFTMLGSINTTVAKFDVPATTALGSDGWTNMQYVLNATHSALKADQNLMLTVTGDTAGTVELDSWWLSYNVEEMPEITVTPDLNDLKLIPGMKLELAVTEKNGGTVNAAILPQGADFDPETGRLTWLVTDDNAGAGEMLFTSASNAGMASHTIRYTVAASIDDVLAEGRARYDGSRTYTVESEAKYLIAMQTVIKLAQLGTDYEVVLGAINTFNQRASELKEYVPFPVGEDGSIDYIAHKDRLGYWIYNYVDSYKGNITDQAVILNLGLANLTDGNPGSHFEIRPRVPTDAGETYENTRAHFTIDFGDGMGVKLSKAEIMPRSGLEVRSNGVVVRGSNDGESWVNLTDTVSGLANGTQNLLTLDVSAEERDTAYRYIRVINTGTSGTNANNFLSLAEYHIFGEVVQNPQISLEEIAYAITIDSPAEGAAALDMPALYGLEAYGYGVSIKSSGDENIIALDGTVTPPEADTVVELVFTVTKGDDYADTMPIEVMVPGKASSVVSLDVSVSTPTIVETLAANLAVTVKGENLESLSLKAYLLVNGELMHETDIVGGKGTMRIPAAPEARSYSLVVKAADDSAQGTCLIDVTEYNTDIWSAYVYRQDGKIRVRFNEDIDSKAGFAAKVGGATCPVSRIDPRTLELGIDEASVAGGTSVVVSGVKYPRLFPSYSFTFTLTCP